jgi:ABC-2 type transport system permease protein
MLKTFRRGGQVASAFIWMGYKEMLAYPLGFFITQISAVVSTLVYYFIAQLVLSGPNVGGDYYSFVVIGIVALQVMSVGLSAFTVGLDYIIQQGRFESFLVEPINWRILPFGLAAWPILVNLMTAFAMFVVAVLLGAEFRWDAIPLALVILVLGAAANHAVGVLAASVKVLAKRGDPVVGLYTLATTLLSGAIFPIALLPEVLRWISYCLPPTYVLSALRKILLPGSASLPGPSAGQAILLLLAFMAVLYPLAMFLYARALEYGRRMGLLAGY